MHSPSLLRRDGRRAGRPAVPAIAPTLLGSSACLRDHEPETCLFVSAALVFRGGNTAKPTLDWRCYRRRRCGRWTSRRPFPERSIGTRFVGDRPLPDTTTRGRSSPATAHAFGGGTCPKSVLAGPFRRRRRRAAVSGPLGVALRRLIIPNALSSFLFLLRPQDTPPGGRASEGRYVFTF